MNPFPNISSTKKPIIIDLSAVVVADLESNPAHVYVAGLASGSQATMAAALDKLAGLASGGNSDRLSFDWSALRFQHTAALRAELAETCAPATANKLISALRGVLKSAWQLGLMSAEDYHRAADLRNVSGETLPPGRAIDPGELAALLATCETDPAGVRDAAIICALYCGLRRAEVVGLAVEDLADRALKVRGKRRKERLVPLATGAAESLADWLVIRGDQPGPLFVAIRKGGHLTGQGLTPRAINHILAQRVEAARMKATTPHDFRRTVIGDLLDAGADIATVANLVGHANVNTTRRYDRRGDAAKRRAVGLLHVPYRRRVLREG